MFKKKDDKTKLNIKYKIDYIFQEVIH